MVHVNPGILPIQRELTANVFLIFKVENLALEYRLFIKIAFVGPPRGMFK